MFVSKKKKIYENEHSTPRLTFRSNVFQLDLCGLDQRKSERKIIEPVDFLGGLLLDFPAFWNLNLGKDFHQSNKTETLAKVTPKIGN